MSQKLINIIDGLHSQHQSVNVKVPQASTSSVVQAPISRAPPVAISLKKKKVKWVALNSVQSQNFVQGAVINRPSNPIPTTSAWSVPIVFNVPRPVPMPSTSGLQHPPPMPSTSEYKRQGPMPLTSVHKKQKLSTYAAPSTSGYQLPAATPKYETRDFIYDPSTSLYRPGPDMQHFLRALELFPENMGVPIDQMDAMPEYSFMNLLQLSMDNDLAAEQNALKQ